MIKYEQNHLYLERKVVQFQYVIENALPYKDIVLVLLNSTSSGKKWGEFSNLYAVTPEGENLWTAQLPTTNPGDSFYLVKIQDDKIFAYSNWDYICQIDPQTGKIVEQIFTK